MADRRRYPRVQAEVLWRPAGLTAFHHRRGPRDIGLGGARVYSDERLEIGSRLDLDVLLPDGSTVRCWARVVWTNELGPSHPARFDCGLEFTDLAEEDIRRLAMVLARPEPI